jgi:starch synthase (maltosyl-transferring)
MTVRPVVRPADRTATHAAVTQIGAETSGSRIYYLHSLLAGPLERWAGHLDRCAALGFDAVIIPPPFAPGRYGNLFVVADHRRLDRRIGEGDPLALLARYAEQARARSLVPMLDLVVDRLAAERAMGSELARWYRTPSDDELPDPRRPPWPRGAAVLDEPNDLVGLTEWWVQRLGEWVEAGIRGFRCVRPHRVPAALWRGVIAAIRARHDGIRFIAWTAGIEPAAANELAPCGFDLVSCSTRDWDYRAGWLPETADRLAAVAPLIATPEAPFERRLASIFADTGQARRDAHRALDFASAYGRAWLMPMGFEYGASRAMDAARDRPEDFARLVADAPFDLTGEIAAANARHANPSWPRAARPAQVVSPPLAGATAMLLPSGGDGAEPARLLMVNSRLDAPARIAVSPLLVAGGIAGVLLDDQAGGAPLGPDAAIALGPGEFKVLELCPTAPVAAAPAEEPAAAAAAAASRIAIEAVAPAVDDGHFPVKRIVGEIVEVSADLIADGHDRLGAALLWRPEDETEWREAPMELRANDRWAGSFPLSRMGRYVFTVLAWRDRFASYAEELQKKHAAGLAINLELEEGGLLVAEIAVQCVAAPALAELVETLAAADPEARRRLLLAPATAALIGAARDRPHATRHPVEFSVQAERRAAAFASWYEMFPRSQSRDPDRHGTFGDVTARLPAIRDMGFDVLYFPPIHPIGRVNRKGRNNAPHAASGDPGSPYAIGSAEGGHEAIHPDLGSIADFRRLRRAAAEHGLELALDFAIQCAPDHPWLRQHPEWFDWRPDGSMRYAENPPKKYEDIVNVDFYAPDAVPALWEALREILMFWAGEGVRLFRVDNPHTKPLPFWEWVIAAVRREFPDAIFLAEAFTRPKLMYRLAKVGFSQSYTYFTWRNSKAELTEYLTELTTTAPRDFFRPHFFVNTPDINPGFLQTSGRAGFLIRAALAATLSGLYGMYSGFELCEARALPGREEYLDSEKYQIRVRDWQASGNIIDEISRLNRIRRANPALHTHLGISFHNAFNDQVLYYAKATPDLQNFILVAVNLDPHFPQECDIEVPLWRWGLPDQAAVAVEDLMTGTSLTWRGKVQHIRLDPAALPFAIWRLRPLAGGA